MRLALLIFCASFAAFGQLAPSPVQRFEVASIRVSQGAPQWKFSISGPRLSINSFTLFGLLKEAYNLQNYQIERKGAPSLLLSDEILYDIQASAGSNVNPARDQFRQMLQLLLEDRFHLRVHSEPREMPIYALVIGKNGPKFQPSAPDADPQVTFSLTGENREYSLVTSRKMTLEDLATTIGLVDGRPVQNKTGLEGTWDIRLYNTPDYKMSHGPEPAPGEISILTAIQEQLGLKLEPQKGMVKVLVVDRVERPSEN